MSGGGGGGGGGFTGGDDGELNCNIVERVSLASPNTAVVSGLKRDDVLNVELRSKNGRDYVAAVDANNQVAGAIILSSVKRTNDLIECLRRKTRYKATVRKISGANCEVEARSRP